MMCVSVPIVNECLRCRFDGKVLANRRRQPTGWMYLTRQLTLPVRLYLTRQLTVPVRRQGFGEPAAAADGLNAPHPAAYAAGSPDCRVELPLTQIPFCIQIRVSSNSTEGDRSWPDCDFGQWHCWLSL